MTFTHLQIKTGYSFYNSTITITKLIDKAKSQNVNALTLTDENVLFGAVSFYKACIANGIKPIIGMTISLPAEEDEYELILLAKNNTGYRGLIAVSTEINTKDAVNTDNLKKFSEHLVCIVPSASIWPEKSSTHHYLQSLEEQLKPLSDLFGQNLYIGIEMGDESQQDMLMQYKQLQINTGFNMTALQSVWYLDQHDSVSYDCLQAMKHGQKWTADKESQKGKGHYFRTKEEMEAIYRNWPELMDGISDIVEMCNVSLDFDRSLLPAYPVSENETAHSLLTRLCRENLRIKYQTVTKEAADRLEYELQVIDKLGFSDYFLIVGDFVQFAKNNNIVTGPGRGSAAGSLVAYLMSITNVDPLKHGLLFERFLNPERVTMPDIDIDFSDVRREEVIDYVRDKYGPAHVAQIITFGTFLARSLLRELMKTMDIDYRDQAYILKHIPSQSSKGLLSIIKQSEEFQTYIKQSDQLRLLFGIALKLEGLPRHMSTHAAGIVIGKVPLTEDVPLIKGSHNTYLTQYAMNELEMIGLLKIDILGLRNLTLLERIVTSINRQHNSNINPESFPEDDEKTFTLLKEGKTNGIFQLESQGMKRVLTRLKPSTLDDIIAVNALYRPGPMEQIPTYINRKHQKEKVTYLHPDLKPILEPTYGVLIYQEQIMQIAHQFAGLTLGEADILRRAISKKNEQLILEQKETFIKGCLKKGYDKTIAEEIFSWIYKFANYGFNKSHSVAYSKISYQLSYLKAHYSKFFFAHLLGTAINDASKLHPYIKEAKELGIQILPPSINRSYAYFTVESAGIRIGLMAIKGIGYETVKEIINQRKDKFYKDVFDFCIRAKIKRNNLETLILAGAFDETHRNRASLLASLDQAYERAELFGDISGDLFNDDLQMEAVYTKMDDFGIMQKLSDEKELMQMYVTQHPMETYRKKLTMSEFISLKDAKRMPANAMVKSAVIIEQLKKIHTKRGESMAFVTVGDETDDMEAVIFPSLYREINPNLHEEALIYMEGKISIRNQQKQIIISKLLPGNLEEMTRDLPTFIYIKLTSDRNQEAVLPYLKSFANKNPGEARIILYNQSEKKTYKLDNRYNIYHDEKNMLELKEYFGSENVVSTE